LGVAPAFGGDTKRGAARISPKNAILLLGVSIAFLNYYPLLLPHLYQSFIFFAKKIIISHKKIHKSKKIP
jgi:hypothetical protein